MIGTYGGTWKEWRGREDGEQVVYTDKVLLTDVVYHPITLTKSMRLLSQVVSELRKIYVTGSAKTLHVSVQILTYFYNFKLL